jgi:hypothetical protein
MDCRYGSSSNVPAFKCEALSSNPRPKKVKKKKKRKKPPFLRVLKPFKNNFSN